MKKKTIITRLSGGLGNQMFQYALGVHLAHINNATLLLDTTAFTAQVGDPKKGIRQFVLEKFNINATIADKSAIQKIIQKSRINKIMFPWYTFLPYFKKSIVIEPHNRLFYFDFALANLKINAPTYLIGYWQSPLYFSDCASVIKKHFRLKDILDLKNQKMLTKIHVVNSVSLHVRHGDNATKLAQGHGVLPLTYYKKAINYIKEKVSDPIFFVFSDDPVWAKKHIKTGSKTVYVDINGDEKNYCDLFLLSQCKYHIIGNSTFSWWGAWLSSHRNKIVIAPQKYYQNTAQANKDYYPPDWHLI